MAEGEESNRRKEARLYRIGGVAAFLIILLWIGGGLFMYFGVSHANRGPYGDMFGMINSLFSGFALAGIIFTILLQRQELRYQREELRATREEFKQQNETMQIQRFENTFFKMLELLNNTVSNVYFQFESKAKIHRDEGLRAFHRWPSLMAELYRSKLTDDNRSVWTSALRDHFQGTGLIFEPFFETVSAILQIIDAEFEEDETTGPKNRYVTLLRSQLSTAQMLVLYYYLISIRGGSFYRLANKYQLIARVHPNNLFHISHRTGSVKIRP